MSNKFSVNENDSLTIALNIHPLTVPSNMSYSKFWPKGGLPGILHHYTESLVTFEYASQGAHQPHSILFVGGLSDGLGTSSYTVDVVRGLQSTPWSFFTLNLSSSHQSWGLGHLDRDTDEIARCLHYIKDYKANKFGGGGKIVLMGHSTGSQCVLHYLSRPNPQISTPRFDPDLEHEIRPELDGAIMQSPVSDREAIQSVLQDGIGENSSSDCRAAYEQILDLARKVTSVSDRYDTILPIELTAVFGFGGDTPISCRRFLSLASPDSPQVPAQDDLFSSDLSDEQLARTFGGIQKQGLLKGKLMVAPSGADQSVPDWIDVEHNMQRWKNAVDHGGRFQIWDSEHSGVIPGASHALSDDDQAEPRQILVKKLIKYLQHTELLNE